MNIINDLAELIIRIAMWIVFIRFWMQWAQADFYNPLSQTFIKMSEPLCRPFRKLLPPNRRFDWGSLLVLALLALSRWLIDYVLIDRPLVDLSFILRNSFYLLINVCLMALLFMLFIQAIASWIAGSQQNVAIQLISQLTEPLLTPIRRILPPSGGLDFSPMIAMVLIWLLLRIISPYGTVF